MNPDAAPGGNAHLIGRIRELEARLEESEDTLEAIRRGDIDALVVSGPAQEHRIYTLENADRPYRVLIEQMQEGAVTIGEDGTVLYCNRRLAAMLGVPQERIIGQSLQRFLLPGDIARFTSLLTEARRAGARSELTLRTAEARDIPVYLSLNLLLDGDTALLCGVLTDLTEQNLHLRELAEANDRLLRESAEREQVEDALRQAQKMEAVGQLTGGLAHDFNNLLTGITGSLELLQARVAQGRLGEMDRYITAAQGAASRAASLTHRLLAFSRRQTLDPVPTNPNRLITGMEDLIRRTAGPAIFVETVLAVGLWTTLCDPNQLENAVLNLSINARDAMPDGGKLTIETANVWLDERAAHERDMAAGQYIVVCVTDTGTGMPPDVVGRAFDPFFTTKPIGMGTGLGLSMIYGFARQSGGQARIYSEPGQGTTVRVFLPRHAAAETSQNPPEPQALPERAEANETVLVVDDEPTVRMLVAEVLEELGYATIEAADGPSGLQIVLSEARIDLLITDVGLPGGLNGRQLADAARHRRPDLKILFITGYADNAAVGKGVLERGMQVMTKPFAMTALAAKIRSMLEAG
ncbi:ATP-binding protein [Rhodopila sp.]|uniref:ATP-binding protein n=1 Tax=Rhodopila sp. TaxID=2480087 RepID=UPI003D0B99B9